MKGPAGVSVGGGSVSANVSVRACLQDKDEFFKMCLLWFLIFLIFPKINTNKSRRNLGL